MKRVTQVTRSVQTMALLVVLALGAWACGGSQDECPRKGAAECDGNTAKECSTQEDGGAFGDDILVWSKLTCEGATPHCVHFEVPNSRQERALCSATEDKSCPTKEGEACVNGDVYDCTWEYPYFRRQTCKENSSTCVELENGTAECRSSR